MTETTPKIKCPKCGSEQITANKKGFSGKKAAVGLIATGGLGLLAGTLGSNKIMLYCMNCGNRFEPNAAKQKSRQMEVLAKLEQMKKDLTPEQLEKLERSQQRSKIIAWVVVSIVFVLILRACS